MYASTACVSASMPVAAVIARGNPVWSALSSAAASGTMRGDMIANLRVVDGSDTTAAMVTSDPVPAVVGTAYIGNSLNATRIKPDMWTILYGFVARAAMTFAASIDEP